MPDAAVCPLSTVSRRWGGVLGGVPRHPLGLEGRRLGASHSVAASLPPPGADPQSWGPRMG
jgi:hypothetical protein